MSLFVICANVCACLFVCVWGGGFGLHGTDVPIPIAGFTGSWTASVVRWDFYRNSLLDLWECSSLLFKQKYSLTHFLFRFIFQEFQPKSFHGSHLAITAAAYLYFAEGADRVLFCLSSRLCNNFALCSSIKCQNMNSSYPVFNLIWVAVLFPHPQLPLNMFFPFWCLPSLFSSRGDIQPIVSFSVSFSHCITGKKQSPQTAGLTVFSHHFKGFYQSAACVSIHLWLTSRSLQHPWFGSVCLRHGTAGWGVWWEVQGAEITRVHLDTCSRWSHPEAKVQMAVLNLCTCV